MAISALIPEDSVLAETRAMTRNTIFAALIGVLLLVAVVAWIGARVVRPVKAMSELMQRAGALDFTTDRSKNWVLNYKDEIGDMGRSYFDLKNGVVDMLKELNAQAHDFASTAQNLAAISEESVASMEEVKASVDEVSRLSADNSNSLEATNAGVGEVSHASSATAASAEEGAAIAARTSELTQQAFSEVDGVVASIRQAGERSRESGRSILKVNDSVGAIASFVSTITGIAD